MEGIAQIQHRGGGSPEHHGNLEYNTAADSANSGGTIAEHIGQMAMSLLPKDKDQAVVNLVAALIDRILSEIVQDKQRFDPPDTSNLVLKSGVAQRNQSERKKSGMEAIYHHKVSFITFLLVAGASLVVKTDNVNMIGLKNVLDKAFQDKEIFGHFVHQNHGHGILLDFLEHKGPKAFSALSQLDLNKPFNGPDEMRKQQVASEVSKAIAEHFRAFGAAFEHVGLVGILRTTTSYYYGHVHRATVPYKGGRVSVLQWLQQVPTAQRAQSILVEYPKKKQKEISFRWGSLFAGQWYPGPLVDCLRELEVIYEDGYKEVLRNKWNSLRDAEKKAVTFANEIAGMVWRSIILSVHASPWLDVWTAHESPNNNFTIAKGLQCLFKIKRVRHAFRKQVRSFNNPFAESNAEFRVWGDAASDYELPDTETQEKTEEEKEQEQRLIDQNSALELVVALQAHPFAYCQAHIHFMNHQKT